MRMMIAEKQIEELLAKSTVFPLQHERRNQ